MNYIHLTKPSGLPISIKIDWIIHYETDETNHDLTIIKCNYLIEVKVIEKYSKVRELIDELEVLVI